MVIENRVCTLQCGIVPTMKRVSFFACVSHVWRQGYYVLKNNHPIFYRLLTLYRWTRYAHANLLEQKMIRQICARFFCGFLFTYSVRTEGRPGGRFFCVCPHVFLISSFVSVPMFPLFLLLCLLPVSRVPCFVSLISKNNNSSTGTLYNHDESMSGTQRVLTFDDFCYPARLVSLEKPWTTKSSQAHHD